MLVFRFVSSLCNSNLQSMEGKSTATMETKRCPEQSLSSFFPLLFFCFLLLSTPFLPAIYTLLISLVPGLCFLYFFCTNLLHMNRHMYFYITFIIGSVAYYIHSCRLCFFSWWTCAFFIIFSMMNMEITFQFVDSILPCLFI